METIRAITRYVERTGVNYSFATPYQMKLHEMLELGQLARESPMEAVCLAFDYGRAKGERHARAERKARIGGGKC